MDDQVRYEKSMEEENTLFESLCKRCAECCGSQDGDPCACLQYDHTVGIYFCKNYENRIGARKTVTGKAFTCVQPRPEDAVSLAELGMLDGAPQHGQLLSQSQILGSHRCPAAEEGSEKFLQEPKSVARSGETSAFRRGLKHI